MVDLTKLSGVSSVAGTNSRDMQISVSPRMTQHVRYLGINILKWVHIMNTVMIDKSEPSTKLFACILNNFSDFAILAVFVVV